LRPNPNPEGSSEKATDRPERRRRFTIPKLLAVTMIACTPAPVSQTTCPADAGAVTDAGTLDCTCGCGSDCDDCEAGSLVDGGVACECLIA
jgi:hypothetical protein